jgi:hypothetical protein
MTDVVGGVVVVAGSGSGWRGGGISSRKTIFSAVWGALAGLTCLNRTSLASSHTPACKVSVSKSAVKFLSLDMCAEVFVGGFAAVQRQYSF